MPTRVQHVKHRFAGGWATDFGTGARVAPDESGTVQVPFLLRADDVLFDLSGSLRKPMGATKLNATAFESGTRIHGIFDYWKWGATGIGAQRRVLHVGRKIYYDTNSDGTFVELTSGLNSDAIVNYSTFDDLLIIGSTKDTPRSWDQTTFQTLAGSPPAFSFSVKHKNFHFAAGVDAAPSRLYYSVQLDPENWTGATSGNIDIDPNDGDRITGLVSHKNELWVFKGPYKGSIHRITGTSNADFARSTFIEGVGAVWQNSIFRYRDDIGFLWSDGSIRSLKATDAYGNFQEASLSTPIQEYLDRSVNWRRLQYACALPEPDGGRVWFSLPLVSSSKSVVLVLDSRFAAPRWTRLPTVDVASLGRAYHDKRQELVLGGNDGFARVLNSTTKSYSGTAYSADILTPQFDYSAPERMKILHAVGIGIVPHNNSNVTVGWRRDSNSQQTVTVAQGGAPVLGAFTLGTSVLGDVHHSTRFARAEEGGEFRSIQYEISHAVNNADLELTEFVAGIAPSSTSFEAT